MELKEFIKQTIIEIAEGIDEGHQHVKQKFKGEGVQNGYRNISFDIAITSNDEEKSEKGAKLFVAQVFGVGTSSENKSKNENINRIKFDLHVHVNTK